MLSWLRRVTGFEREPEAIPDLDMLEADAYMGLRSSQRAPVQIGVDQCYVVDPQTNKERWLPITLVDVSNGGARVVSTETLTSGTVMRLSFKLPRGGGDWHGTGRITWVSPSGLLAGMAFNQPTDSGQQAATERLNKYVAQKQSSPD